MIFIRLSFIANSSSIFKELSKEELLIYFNELPKPVLMFCRSGNRSNNLYQLAKQMDLLDD